jgi:5-formyltetrahydrofolate cyclo-ligase
MPSKAQLRQTLKQTRLEMEDGERTLKSRGIVSQLKQLMDWPGIKSLNYFEPIRGLLEPDVSDLITYLEDTYPELQLCVPRLIEDKWEVVGVRGGVPPDEFDAVIVPMLGFDPESLHRIGYGGGYYDKFLVSQPQAQKIGVCFENGKAAQIPAEAYDIQMDLIVTESNIYNKRA